MVGVGAFDGLQSLSLRIPLVRKLLVKERERLGQNLVVV